MITNYKLLSPFNFLFKENINPLLFSEENLRSDILESLNLIELGKRQFREIARVAGLVFQNQSGTPKKARQVQVSSSLLYDVFKKYEPSNLFL